MMPGDMGKMLGGSAYAMVQQIADGYVLVTERSFSGMTPADLQQLLFELEKHLRTVRSEQPPADDVQAVQTRHRKIQRLTSCRLMIQNYRKRFRH